MPYLYLYMAVHCAGDGWHECIETHDYARLQATTMRYSK